MSEKEKISQRREKIKDLLDKGLKQKEIYSQLNISKRTCISDIRYFKKTRFNITLFLYHNYKIYYSNYQSEIESEGDE